MTNEYEELQGALDAKIRYRPPRERVGRIFSPESNPSIVIGDQSFPALDISHSGVSFFAKGEPDFKVGQEIHVRVVVHGRTLYEEVAEVVRVELRSRGRKVGVFFPCGFVDLDQVNRTYLSEQLSLQLDRGPKPFRGAAPEEYRNRVVQAYEFLMHTKRVLDEHESGTSSDDAIETAARVADTLRGPWSELCRGASDAAKLLLPDRDALGSAKQYTETMITPLLMRCPMVARSYTKPLGYPGDYQVMLYYYANDFEGDTVFAKVFHKFFVEHPLSNGVRTRSGYVADLIREQVFRFAESSPERRYRILSIGCGPAHEANLLYEEELPAKLDWLLIDQEEEALDVAFRNVKSRIAAARRSDLCRLYNTSFATLLSNPEDTLPIPPQDFIFCTGLFDYLGEKKAASLVLALYNWLAPNGTIAIGNALAPNNHFWSPEFVLDWSLMYRSDAQMRRLGNRLPESAIVETAVEPGDAYRFLLVRKPPTMK